MVVMRGGNNYNMQMYRKAKRGMRKLRKLFWNSKTPFSYFRGKMLRFLLNKSTVILEKPKTPYKQRRKGKNRPNGICEVCGNKAEVVHHVFLLKNNGSDCMANRMNLCNDCHCIIHP